MKTGKEIMKTDNLPKIYICTPSFNSEKTIEDTILSVLEQNGKFQLYYHIQDGGSTDLTLSIIEKYQKRILANEFENVHFTFDSSNDAGMYDAILKGFASFKMSSNDWMAWINSDDRLAPDALNFISGLNRNSSVKNVEWVGGKTSMMNENGKLIEFLLPTNSEIIKLGLSDGIHWGYLQQEGVFFRNSLWNKIDIQKCFSSYKYAGDWALWCAFAEHAKIYQVDKVLGTFYKRKGQISEVSRDDYLKEVNEKIALSLRYKSFINLNKSRQIRSEISMDGNYNIKEFDIKGAVNYWQTRRKDEGLYELMAHKKVTKNIIAFDAQWQFPAITEKHAFHKVQEMLVNDNSDTVYFAFPWATLIDLVNNKKPDADKILRILRAFKNDLKGKRVITVCQHIFMTQYQDLFNELGISDIYWTHAVHNETSLTEFPHINVHPFPLYPVQAIDFDTEKNISDRKYLFSFVGARANQWYLTESRNLIIDLLKDSVKGKVIARDTWHYQKAVYDHQVNKGASKDTELVDKDTTDEFKNILGESVFALCPSGSGPNSIRLWEAIGYGVIPVILADTYLPPGNPKLWAEAAVFCKEDATSIKALPEVLAEIAKDKALLLRKRHALKQLWLIYGPDCFVYDILKCFIQYGQEMPKTGTVLLNCKESSELYKDNDLFLLSCTSKLLLNPKAFLNDIHLSEENTQNLSKAIKSNSKYLDVFNRVLLSKNIELRVG